MAKGFKGGFGMGGNMGADQLEIDATAGGGVVKMVISGTHEIKSLTIDPSAVDPDDVEMLQDLIIAAYNEAARKLAEVSAEKMSKATGGAKLPF